MFLGFWEKREVVLVGDATNKGKKDPTSSYPPIEHFLRTNCPKMLHPVKRRKFSSARDDLRAKLLPSEDPQNENPLDALAPSSPVTLRAHQRGPLGVNAVRPKEKGGIREVLVSVRSAKKDILFRFHKGWLGVKTVRPPPVRSVEGRRS